MVSKYLLINSFDIVFQTQFIFILIDRYIIIYSWYIILPIHLFMYILCVYFICTDIFHIVLIISKLKSQTQIISLQLITGDFSTYSNQ